MGEIRQFPKPMPRGFIEAFSVVLKVFNKVWISLDQDENGLSEFEVVGIDGDCAILRVPIESVREFQIKGEGPPLATP
jgi:hypothetical protein